MLYAVVGSLLFRLKEIILIGYVLVLAEVDAQLVNEAKITSEKDRFVVLSWDK